ncbi:MAG: hypothetical protein AAFU58_01500 [Pseudomonadota bacterium]
MENRWVSIGVESIAIVFGVLLALALNNWHENRQKTEFGERNQAIMVSELRKNYDAILLSRDYHLKFLSEIIETRDAFKTGEDYSFPPYYGLQPPQTRNAGYQTAVASTVFAEMEPEASSELIFAFDTIRKVHETHASYANILPSIGDDTGRFLNLISYGFADFLYTENAALRAIAPIIDKEPPPLWTTQTDKRPY